MSIHKKLFCESCAKKRIGVLVAQGSWLKECSACGARTGQAFEVVQAKKKAPEKRTGPFWWPWSTY